MKTLLISLFILRISYFDSQINQDSILEASIYLPKVSWFSTQMDCLKKEIKYSNGQKYFIYKFNSDSILSEYTYFFKNGKIAFHANVIGYKKEIWNETDFALTVSEIHYSYYKSGNLRHFCINSLDFYSFSCFSEKGKLIYSEKSKLKKKEDGVFVDSFENTIPGIVYKYYKKEKLRNIIITDYDNHILKITNAKGKIIERKLPLKYFEKIISFKIGTSTNLW